MTQPSPIPVVSAPGAQMCNNKRILSYFNNIHSSYGCTVPTQSTLYTDAWFKPYQLYIRIHGPNPVNSVYGYMVQILSIHHTELRFPTPSTLRTDARSQLHPFCIRMCGSNKDAQSQQHVLSIQMYTSNTPLCIPLYSPNTIHPT